MGWNKMGRNKMGWNKMGWDKIGWDKMGWDKMGWDGIQWDGMWYFRNSSLPCYREWKSNLHITIFIYIIIKNNKSC